MSLRTGYTTGSCATAATKAAVIGLFKGNIPDEVEIDTPSGIKLQLKILHKQLSNDTAECAVQKDAGDDPDVTNGCKVHAQVERNNTGTIEIDGGEGVGRVTKPGLQAPVGHAAINPVPRRMIEHAVREVIGNGAGVKVIISVPNGRALGEKTFNPKLGIIGGISIIGTTGIVRPMSEDAFKTSLLCGLDIAKGIGYETVVLAPGSLGERSMLNLIHIPKDQIIQMSNFVGFMLEAALKRRFKKIILAGHPGKLIKLLRGDFHTHSAVSKPANDILIDILEHHRRNKIPPPISPPSQGGIADEIFNNLKEVSTVEGIVELLRFSGNLSIMNDVSEMIEDKVLDFLRGEQPFAPAEAGVILFDMKGSIVGISDSAQAWLNLTKTKSS
ncbi:MAG: cobalamin biosynthesis protein CbiD [Planctomycetota bacterium]|nr:cobalamin biosynthesis protein CbiD [Planctomycetota bacterium]MDE1889191.1 cobalamin biosynthesis protein CbiD [Planctomycetota bacterium]MDE2216710.1 cobalamin biosynthesis protein CbiD [Planctomycetota bacterium]